jgi:hypothetical protein
MSFSRIWEAVKGISREKQERLFNLLQLLLDRGEEPLSEEEKLELEMLKEGILDSVPATPFDQKTFEEWVPVTIEGKPLSETIIEERR